MPTKIIGYKRIGGMLNVKIELLRDRIPSVLKQKLQIEIHFPKIEKERMMMPAKKSIHLILAEGKSHLTKEEIERRIEEESAIKINNDNVKAPNWLKDKIARKEFKRIATELMNINLVTNLDVDLLAMYCQAYAAYQKATEELQDQPLSITKYDKYERPYQVENPLIKIQIKYSDEMKKIASQMGLSISSRIKLVPPTKPEPKKNKFEDMMDD